MVQYSREAKNIDHLFKQEAEIYETERQQILMNKSTLCYAMNGELQKNTEANSLPDSRINLTYIATRIIIETMLTRADYKERSVLIFQGSCRLG